MNYLRPELIEKLAAEYALGTLKGLARRRFERLIKEHSMIQRRVNAWQDKLTPMDLALKPVQPPARVWKALEQRLRINGRSQSAPAGRNTWLNSLAFWRGMAGFASAAALVLAVYVVVIPQSTSNPAQTVAVLGNDKAEPVLVASLDAKEHLLHLATIGSVQAPTNHDFELWALPPGKAPISLGVVRTATAVTVRLDAAHFAALSNSNALAITLEPVGGSPTGGPTGPILYSGKLQLKSA